MQLTQNCAAHETKAGDWILVSMHIIGGSAGSHKTDLLIIDEGKWEEARLKLLLCAHRRLATSRGRTQDSSATT